MISQDELKEMRESIKIMNQNPLAIKLQGYVETLLDELDRLRKVHSEEQGRAADRLREALENG